MIYLFSLISRPPVLAAAAHHVSTGKMCIRDSIKGVYYMGFSLDISVPVLTVFFQGLISFFSPCVLPLIPLYIGYLSGGTGSRGEDGRIYYKRSKVMLHTLCLLYTSI